MSERTAEMLRYAEYYVNKLGFSVIPVNKDKTVPIKWKEFQERRATNEEIKKWFENPEYNIGIVTGSVSGICVVDIDSDDGAANVEAISPGAMAAPSVTTPHGGMHLYFRNCPHLRNSVKKLGGTDFRGEGGFVVAPPSVGLNGTPYRWTAPLESFAAGTIPSELESELSRLAAGDSNDKGENKVGSVSFTIGQRDNDLFNVAHKLTRGGMARADAEEVLLRLAKTCTPPFPNAEALAKVRSAIELAARKERNLTEEIREYAQKMDGYFSVHEMCQDLGIFTKEDKNKAYVILSRLKESGLIEKHGERGGVYRKIEHALEEIDWLNADMDEHGLLLPLGLSDFVRVFPNNIIVVAGSPDSGKTAFMFNVVKLNMDTHPIYYFNSEMGEAEFKSRIRNHKDKELTDWKFKAYHRKARFADCIVPDAVNIIDYLEISDAFYKVSSEIDEIYRRLKGGVAIIGLQKGYNCDIGRGGTFGLEKPRLYLSIDRGRIKIVKAKNWVDPTKNPNGLYKTFKLLGGASFIETSSWLEDIPEFKGVKKNDSARKDA